MTSIPYRIAVLLVSLGIAVAISFTVSRHIHRAAGPVDIPDLPPVGWTVVCQPAAIADVCQTYPPGDDRWQPSPPVPPQPPLPTPWPGGAR